MKSGLAEDAVSNWVPRWKARRREQLGVYRVVQPSELKLRPLAANARRPAHPLLGVVKVSASSLVLDCCAPPKRTKWALSVQ